jgi:hypothetical protein
MDPLVPAVIILTIATLLLGGWKILDLTKTSTPGTSSDVIQLFISYVPINLTLFGALLDIYNSQYHYSVASITSICGVLINGFLGGTVVNGVVSGSNYIGQSALKLTKSTTTSLEQGVGDAYKAVQTTAESGEQNNPFGEAPTTGGAFSPNPFDEKWCTLPGFEKLENGIAPQSIIMSMTFLMYLFFELVGTGHVEQSIGIGITTLVVLIVQSAQLIMSGCLEQYVYGKYWSILIAVLMSAAFAGSSFGIQMRIWNGDVLPSPFNTSGGVGAKTGLTSVKNPYGGTPVAVGAPSAHSLPVDDQDQFVCEAYRDGELVTSTIVE